VFTHTTEDDMLDAVKWLYSHLTPGGKLMSTFCSVDNPRAVLFATRGKLYTFKMFDWYTDRNVVYLSESLSNVDNPVVGKMLFTFYRIEHLKSILSKYDLEIFAAPLDIKNSFQECFVITKPY